MKRLRRHICLTYIVGLSSFILSLFNANAQTTESPCRSANVLSVPSRPALASATDPTQCGVVEAEYGFEQTWLGGGNTRDDLTGGLRMGITPNMDLHWSSGDYVGTSDAQGATQRGFGDTYLGVKYRFFVQTKKRPALGFFYAAKVPSAAAAIGGSGQVDHILSAIVSKDIHPFHFDFNVIPQFIGRTVGGGSDKNVGFALATWLPVNKKVTLILEPYGYTALNSTTPGFASANVGVSYQLRPRVYLDTGIDTGVSHSAPQKRVYGGVTYALANFYKLFDPTH